MHKIKKIMRSQDNSWHKFKLEIIEIIIEIEKESHLPTLSLSFLLKQQLLQKDHAFESRKDSPCIKYFFFHFAIGK